MLAAIYIARTPVRINAERDIALVLQRATHDRGTVENIGIGTNKTIGHILLGAKERGQDIVVLPVGVMAINQLRVVGLNLLDAIAADKNRRFQPGRSQRLEYPVEDSPPADAYIAFGLPVGQVIEPTAATGTDDDGAH